VGIPSTLFNKGTSSGNTRDNFFKKRGEKKNKKDFF